MPNVDPKQIAAIEKAIEEKYGNIAVLDPSSLWTTEKEKAYLDQIKSVEKYYRQQAYENYTDQGGFILKEKLVSKKLTSKTNVLIKNKYVINLCL